MRRNKTDSTDSTELLLDTMCNAFGGIVLIAMLIAMLGGSDPDDPPTPDHSREKPYDPNPALIVKSDLLGDSIIRRKNEITWRETQITTNTTIFTEFVQKPPKGKLENIQANHRRTNAAWARETSAFARLQIQHRTLIDEINRTDHHKRPEERRLPIPKMSIERDKFTHFLWIKDGKLYPVSSLAANGLPLYDAAHVTSTRVAQYNCDYIELRQDRGLRGKASMQNYLDRCAKARPSKHFFFSFRVHPNSFALFVQLKQSLRSLGYQYNWAPSEEKGLIIVEVDEVEAQ